MTHEDAMALAILALSAASVAALFAGWVLRAQRDAARDLCASLADRCDQQSRLLSKAAERRPGNVAGPDLAPHPVFGQPYRQLEGGTVRIVYPEPGPGGYRAN